MGIAGRVASNHQSRFRAAHPRAAVRWVAAVCLFGLASLAQAAGPSYSVRGVSWSGPIQPRTRRVLAGWVAGQVGHKVDLAQARAMARAATPRLRQAGDLVALVVLTQEGWQGFQRTGNLAFRVFEGRVGAVRIQSNTSHVASARLERVAREALCPRGLRDCVLSKRGMERAQLLLQDIPGVRLAPLALTPRGVSLGQTAVQIAASASEPRVTGAVSLDDYGVPQSGENRAGVSLSANNLLHMGEVWTGSFQDTDRHEATGALGLSLPLGYQGWHLDLNGARTTYAVPLVQASGTADTATAGVSYPVVRGLGSDWRVSLDGVWTRSELTVIGLPAAAPRRIVAAAATLSGDSGARNDLLWGDTWSAALSVVSGTVSQSLTAPDTTGVLGRFTKVTGSGLAKVNLDKGGLYTLWSVRGQWSDQNLDPYEELPVGGPTGVRAFSTAEGSLTRGVFSTLELRQRLPWRGNVLAPGVFVDYANGDFLAHPYPSWQLNLGYGGSSLPNHRVWSDYGLGLDWASPRGLALSVEWATRMPGSAQPLYRPPGSAQNRWLGSVSWQF